MYAQTQLKEGLTVQPMIPSSLIDTVTAQLEQHPNHLRIKKLLFAICHHTWENDLVTLEQFHLRDLVQEGVRLHPTPDHLNAACTAVVSTLNRQAEYQWVAQTILMELAAVYAAASGSLPDASPVSEGKTEATGAIAPIPTVAPSYSAIAQTLQAHPNLIRLHKLLYGAAYGTWENSPEALRHHPLAHLIQAVHRLAPTAEALQYCLEDVVKTLNRQAEYRLVAHVIVAHLSPLYGPPPAPKLNPEASPEASPQINAQSRRVVKLPRASVPPAAPPDPSPPPAAPMQGNSTHPACFDPYTARLDIMRYANPLRAKILLFSSLYSPFQFTDEDWLSLRRYTLHDLLEQAWTAYSTAADLETQLTQAVGQLARCDENCDENSDNENSQVMTTILRALQPYYRDASVTSISCSPQPQP